MKLGNVVTHVKRNSLGFVESRDFTFEGRVFLVDFRLCLDEKIKIENKRFTLGGQRLVITSEDFISGNFTAVKEEDWLARLYFWGYHASEIFRLIYRRIILTLVIWRLAEYHPGEIPGWWCVVERWKKKGGVIK